MLVQLQIVNTVTTKKRKLSNDFFFWGGGGAEKIIDFHNDSLSVALPFKKTFTTEFRQRYDFEFRFGIESLKS